MKKDIEIISNAIVENIKNYIKNTKTVAKNEVKKIIRNIIHGDIKGDNAEAENIRNISNNIFVLLNKNIHKRSKLITAIFDIIERDNLNISENILHNENNHLIIMSKLAGIIR